MKGSSGWNMCHLFKFKLAPCAAVSLCGHRGDGFDSYKEPC